MAIVTEATGYAPIHRQVRGSIGVYVDEGVVDLLEALWARGLRTEFSCQGGEGRFAHVCFSTIRDAIRFAAGPGDLVVTRGRRRAWVDFPAAQIDMLTRHWATSGYAAEEDSERGAA